MKLLKFIALIAGMYVVGVYVPFGNFINLGIIGVGLWKLV